METLLAAKLFYALLSKFFLHMPDISVSFSLARTFIDRTASQLGIIQRIIRTRRLTFYTGKFIVSSSSVRKPTNFLSK